MSQATDRKISSIELNSDARCSFITARKGRCDGVVTDERTGFCIVHGRLQERRRRAEAQKISREIFGDNPSLENRDEIRSVVSNLMRMFSEKRIARSDAALLAYMSSLALQSLPLRKLEKEEEPEFQLVWDIPPLSESEKKTEPGQLSSHFPPGNAGPMA